jgi:hypothetical protein
LAISIFSHFYDGLCIIDFLKIDIGFYCKIKIWVKTAYKSLNINVIPTPWDQLDCISPYMVLDARVFKISLLGQFANISKLNNFLLLMALFFY